MNKRFTRILATSITAAALIGSLGACGKGSASATSEGANEITLWTHNAGNPEELAAIEVTSVSKKTEKRFETAAAVHVITGEELRRSGFRRLSEAGSAPMRPRAHHWNW